MSATKSLHYELCLEGAKWLRRRQDTTRCKKQQRPCYQPGLCSSCRQQHKYVAVELCTVGTENCDVWGYDGYMTTVIEVKVSRADFRADQKKYWRNVGDEYRAGNRRWYLTPKGMIDVDELPEGYGLLEWDGKQIVPVVAPKCHIATGHADLLILYSILRREGFPQKIFNYRGAPSTIQPKTINGIPEREWLRQQREEMEKPCEYEDGGKCLNVMERGTKCRRIGCQWFKAKTVSSE